MAKALGTDDSINTCDCCGRTELKFTVLIELDDGEIVNYGQVCAGRNTGKTRPQMNAEMKSARAQAIEAARKEWFTSEAYAAEEARFQERAKLKMMPGKDAMEFVREAVESGRIAREAIASKYAKFKVSSLSLL